MNPSRMSEVNNLLLTYKGREEELLESLNNQYPSTDTGEFLQNVHLRSVSMSGENDLIESGYILSGNKSNNNPSNNTITNNNNNTNWNLNSGSNHTLLLKQKMLEKGVSHHVAEVMSNSTSEML
jgi:hypothetical protein